MAIPRITGEQRVHLDDALDVTRANALKRPATTILVLEDEPAVLLGHMLKQYNRLEASTAYGVLAKPFDATEVVRTLGLAWQRWQDRHKLHANRTKQRMAATGT
ncbi:MAG: hypothetical protein ABSH00_04430 [Bryobacteraceae bacterium]|jgi:AmiR/NasT family two-component response regulator